MGITLSRDAMRLVIDEVVARARGKEAPPRLWTERVERLGALGVKTYVAALGGALLAKSTDARVDALTQDVKAGPRGYSLRTVTEFLAHENHGRYHMGATGRNPMNNRPFLGGPSRIDEFTKINPRARASFDLFLDCLTDLNHISVEKAKGAFLAWMAARMQAQGTAEAEARRSLDITTGLDVATLVEVAERFVTQDPEGGRRGQAFVAAALDCAFDDVVLQPINNPNPGDVRVLADGNVVWIVEVKQVPVDERTAVELAEEARDMGVPLALLVVIADQHQPLERDRIRHRALREQRVMLEIAEGVWELVTAISVFTRTPPERIVAELPSRYAARMREHGISERARDRWADLMSARSD